MLTLIVALGAPEFFSHESAAAWIAEGVGRRYSRELARMMFRSCTTVSVSTWSEYVVSRFAGMYLQLRRQQAYRISTFKDANKHAAVSRVDP